MDQFIHISANSITILGLLFSNIGAYYAWNYQFEQVFLFFMLSMICDLLDGTIARLSNINSLFGHHLDSKCDFINFGFVPCIIVFFYLLYRDLITTNAYIVFIILFIFQVCVLIRLVKYSISTHQTDHFSGLPSPIMSLLVYLPIMLDYKFSLLQSYSNTILYLYMIYILIIAILGISYIKIPSFKTLPKLYFLPLLPLLIIYPIYSMIIISIIFLCIFMISIYNLPFLK